MARHLVKVFQIAVVHKKMWKNRPLVTLISHTPQAVSSSGDEALSCQEASTKVTDSHLVKSVGDRKLGSEANPLPFVTMTKIIGCQKELDENLKRLSVVGDKCHFLHLGLRNQIHDSKRGLRGGGSGPSSCISNT